MKSMRKITVVVLVVASLLVFTTRSAKAECCYFNPLALPFMVAGAVVGTAAAITTGILGFPFYAGSPYYYGPSYYAPAPGYYGSSYYGPSYYGPGYYAPYAPVSFYFGSGYYGYPRGYYGRGPYWGRGGAWGPRYYNRYGGGGPRYHRGAVAAGSGRYVRTGYRTTGR